MSSVTLQRGGKSRGAGTAPTVSALTHRLLLTRCLGGNLPQAGLGSCPLPWSHLSKARVQGWTQHAPGTGTAAGPCQGSEEKIRRGGIGKGRTEKAGPGMALSLTGGEAGQRACLSGSCWGAFAGEAWKQEGKADTQKSKGERISIILRGVLFT